MALIDHVIMQLEDLLNSNRGLILIAALFGALCVLVGLVAGWLIGQRVGNFHRTR